MSPAADPPARLRIPSRNRRKQLAIPALFRIYGNEFFLVSGKFLARFLGRFEKCISDKPHREISWSSSSLYFSTCKIVNSLEGNGSPSKPWERVGSASGPTPFKPASGGSTRDIVEASGIAQPGEVVSTADGNTIVNNTLGRPVPTRPWKQQTYGSTYGAL